ncbi:MAG TPA: hypothetical protein VNE39_26375 [Planctomycetota bacterium]|nr:hypothetical protein [Planctomycetota bacterium]
MARLIVFITIVAAGVAAALFLVSERSAVTSVGYRVARLEGERRKLIEGNRKLEAQIAVARTPGAIAAKVKGLQLDLVPPDESLDRQLAREKEDEKASPGNPASRTRKGR